MNRIISLLLLLCIASSATAQQWEQTNGVGGDGTQSIAVNSQGHIFVAARALHRSMDRGKTWTRLFPEAISGSIKKIIIQPSGRIIVTARITNIPYLSYFGVFGSDDNGNSWKQLYDSVTNIFTGASGSLFAILVGNLRVVRSSNNGDSWNELDMSGIFGQATAASEDGSGTLYICATYLYRSTDDGYSWGKIQNGISISSAMMTIAPDGTPYVYDNGGLFHSVDNGRTWSRVNINNHGIGSMAFSKNNIFAVANSNDGLISYSSDNGTTWIKPSIGNQQPIATTAACVADLDGTFIFTLQDHLRRFDPIDISNASLISIPNGNITTLVAGRDESIIAFSASLYSTYYFNYGWKSNDQGNNWLVLNGENYVFQNEGVPISHGYLDSSGTLLGVIYDRIIQSTDAGFSWTILSYNLTNGMITSLAIDRDNSLFACSSTEGVFRTTDHGKTWDQLNSGIQDQQLSVICADANGDMYTGGLGKLYRSTNKGITWTRLPFTNQDPTYPINSISVSKQGTLYISSSTHLISKSTDKGLTWTSDSSSIPATKSNELLSTPDGKTFVATDNGVFYIDSKPNSTWHPYSDGLTALNVQTLCIDPKGFLYAGTDVSGIFKTKATFGTTTRGVPTNSISATFSLSAPYPNPASTSTTIPFSVSERADVRLDVTDALGRI
ncbi:MAG TPA: YCF48-related protein, partial [Candidatus Kapabacteria bacterium]|nr:YCF48-related protein [Candidatus Kapabacteria bacterium]